MKKKLYVSQIDDVYIQQNFKTIGELFNGVPWLKGEWRFFSFEITTAGTNQKLSHNLGYTPTDIIVTSTIGGTIVFNYNNFTSQFLDVTTTVTSSPLKVRAFIGRYSEDAVNV